MTFSKIKSYAKINLSLNITGKSSCLHKIESIVAFINLYDDILVKRTKSKRHSILFKGKFSKNIGKNNTILKLLKLLEKKSLLYNKKFEIKIIKRIPNKSGLGGGSMNAANLLKYFIKKKIIKVTKNQTLAICKSVGSDVILGLNSTNSILTSKNDVKRFTNYKKIYTLIVKPNFGCSTKELYSEVKKYNKPKINRPNKKMFNLNYLKEMNNSLEYIAFSKYNKLRIIKSYLEKLSRPSFVRMTGSGSALVAYFQSKERCNSARKQFSKKYKNYWCIAAKTI